MSFRAKEIEKEKKERYYVGSHEYYIRVYNNDTGG